jgi:hypothetical protein
MVSVQVGLGGRRVNLTPAQEALAQFIARQSLAGQPPSLSGRNPNVVARSGFLLERGQREAFAVGVPTPTARTERQRLFQETFRRTPPSVLKTIRPTPKVTIIKLPPKRITISRVPVKKITFPTRIKFPTKIQRKEFLIQEEKRFARSLPGIVFEVVSAGTLSRRKLDRKTNSLNEDVDKFNREFGGRELSEVEFNKASSVHTSLRNRESKLKNEKDKLENLARVKIGKFIFRLFETKKEFGTTEEARSNQIKRNNNDIQKLNDRLKKLKGKKGKVTEFRRKNIKGLIRSNERDNKRIEAGGAALLVASGVVPLTPVIAPIGFPKNTKVTFVGTQKVSKNKIITDVFFRSGRKRIGVARGVTVTKGSKGTTVVLGKSGVQTLKIPKAKIVLTKKQVFAGVEKTLVDKGVFKLQATTKGKLTLIKRNIVGFKQAGVGKVATVKGTRFFRPVVKFPTGKITQVKVPNVRVDNFASLAAIFTKKDLSLIIGKAITSSKNKAQFIGLIKGVGKVSKNLGGVKQIQFSTAMQKVISVTAASLAKADKVKGLTKVQTLALAREIAVTTVLQRVSKAKVKPRVVLKKKPVAKPALKPPTPKQISKARQVTKSVAKAKASQTLSSNQREEQRIRERLEQLQKQQQRTRQKTVQRSLQAQRQRLRLRLRTLQKQKTVLKRIAFTGVPVGVTQMGLISLFLIKKKKKKKKVVKGKVIPSFDVFGKSGKRFIKLNKVPLSRGDALSKGTFMIDNTTSRSFKIVPRGKRKTLGQLKGREQNYFKRAGFKLREVKIRKGRKFAIKPRYIEKTKHAIDTRGEKRGLTLARLAKQRGIKVPKRRIRKASPAQLAALKKGRAKLKKMRKKR